MNDTNREAEMAREWVVRAEARISHLVEFEGDREVARHGRYLLAALDRERERNEALEAAAGRLAKDVAEIGACQDARLRPDGSVDLDARPSLAMLDAIMEARISADRLSALLATEDTNETQEAGQ